MEKKKTSYYYDENTEALINQGMNNYKKRNYGSDIKLSSFIDMCIKQAVETLPNEIQTLTSEKNSLTRKNLEQQREIEKLEHLIFKINKNNNERTLLNEAIQEVINRK